MRVVSQGISFLVTEVAVVVVVMYGEERPGVAFVVTLVEEVDNVVARGTFVDL